MARLRIPALLERPAEAIGPAAQTPRKTRAALVSIVSNAALIVLKLFAGALTGSIAILTEAVHSAIDLVASVIAFWSVRKADEPADESHLYGHEKAENVAAGIEGMLILVGAGIIIYESARRLVNPQPLDLLGVGLGVVAFSALVNVGVSIYLYRRARQTESAALEADAAHLRTDAMTSVGVFLGLGLAELTDNPIFDPLTALVVAAAIVSAGVRILNRSSRVLMDEALPPEELEAVRAALEGHPASELAGFHKLRARRAGSRRHVDLHVQFREGTSLERAHELSHELQAAIRDEVPGSEVLIHLEPARPPSSATEVDRRRRPDGEQDP